MALYSFRCSAASLLCYLILILLPNPINPFKCGMVAEKGFFLGSKVLASSPRVSSTSIMNPPYSLLFPPMRCVGVKCAHHATLTTLRSTPKDYGFHPRAQQNDYSLQAQHGDNQSQSTPALGNNDNDINNDNNPHKPVDEGEQYMYTIWVLLLFKSVQESHRSPNSSEL